MNCIEFLFRHTTDPHGQDPVLLRHRHECPACNAFAAQQLAFEKTLREAVRLPVPSTLAARLVLNQAIHGPRPWRRFAVAATFLLTLGIAAGLWWSAQRVSLEESVLAHVLDERDLLATRGSVPATDVASILRTAGVVLRKEVGAVRYAGVCQIRQHAGGHLVVPGRHGPVTVLLLPKEPVASRRTVAAHGFHGVIVPLGHGSMAIIGEPGEEIGPIEQRLQTALQDYT